MPQDRRFEFQFRIALAGNSGVGKTAMMVRFTKGTFQERLSTVGICSDSKILTLDDQSRVKVEIWDTAGQERYRTITQSYYRNANGLVLLYDITKSETLSCLREWIHDIRKYTSTDTKIILAGAKLDLAAERREVTQTQARCFASHYPEIIDVVETSSKNCVNIDMVFLKLSRALKGQHESLRKTPFTFNESISVTKPQTTICGCCN